MKDEKIRNCEIRQKFGNMPPKGLIIAKKELKWVGKIVRMYAKQVPPKIFTCFLRTSRFSGRRFHTTRDGLFVNLQHILPELDASGSVKTWHRIAIHTKFWDKCLDALINNTELPVFNEKEWHEPQCEQSGPKRFNRGQEQRNNVGNNEESEYAAESNGSDRQYGAHERKMPQNNKTNSDRQNSPDLRRKPNFFLHLSHAHRVSSARICLQVTSTDQLRTITLQYQHGQFTSAKKIQFNVYVETYQGAL